eukprot:IDg9739t1
MVVLKLARRWARRVKSVSESKSIILLIGSSQMSRTLIANQSRLRMSGLQSVEYNNLDKLKQSISNPKVAAVVVPPIQDEDVHVPNCGYLRELEKLCIDNNVLLVADETITGLGRVGNMLGIQWDDIKPDLVILGDSLGGGLHPISIVMGSSHIIDLLEPCEAEMSMNGSPLAHSMALETLKLVVNENYLKKLKLMVNAFEKLSATWMWIG